MAIPVAENWTLNAEARAKISAKVSGAKNGMFGRPSWCKGQTKATNPTLARISQKLSEQKKGVQPKQFRGIMNDEIRAKISKAHMGQKASIEARRKMSEHRKKKPVLCVETGEVFATSAIATMAVGLKSSSNIRACIKGLQNTAGQYHWTFAAEKVDE